MISVDYMVVVWVNLMGGFFGVLLGIELGIVVLLSGWLVEEEGLLVMILFLFYFI